MDIWDVSNFSLFQTMLQMVYYFEGLFEMNKKILECVNSILEMIDHLFLEAFANPATQNQSLFPGSPCP